MAFEVWTHPAITAFKCHYVESPMGGTTKNLKILRGVYPACPERSCVESAEGLRMTKILFSKSTKLGRLT
jgi:hypothetical protein